MVALAGPFLLGSPVAPRYIPCWPNPSGAVLFWTRGIERLTSGLLVQMPFVFVLLFVLDHFVGYVLHSIGYDGLFFFNAQYAYLSTRFNDIGLVDFQVFELAIWLSIGIWGVRFLLGLIFLKQYDRYFLVVADPYRANVYGTFLGMVVCAFVLASVKLQADMALFSVVMESMPRVYFIFISTMWFWCIWLISVSALFVVWKVFRQKAPWAVLWRDDPKTQGGG